MSSNIYNNPQLYSELTLRIALSRLKGMTFGLAGLIESRFSSLNEFFASDSRSISTILGTQSSKMFAREVLDMALAQAQAEEQWILSNKVKPLYFTDPDYPTRLLDCDDAPIMLYVLGNANLNPQHVIGIVGTRHATVYGLSFITRFIQELSTAIPDLLIVSGLAYGIDIAAHREALNNDLATAGVVAHGLSTIYPASHRKDAANMIHGNGAVITEYVHDAPIHRGNFLTRNRIVAGMSDALIVVESAAKGGALLTARVAGDYNRDVFAVPGRTTDIYSAGCNELIRKNRAAMITSAADLCDAMGWAPIKAEGTQQEIAVELSDEEKVIIDYLTTHGESFLNRMSVDLNIVTHRLIQILGEMEFNGLVISHPGGKYSTS
ncbi:MAG: DNA-processing protein DprA [Muribaculaceae bacterium]|nr:DNA-processing protein DprA [Muribaculaceae bacterium]